MPICIIASSLMNRPDNDMNPGKYEWFFLDPFMFSGFFIERN